jgi:hypothetical protein
MVLMSRVGCPEHFWCDGDDVGRAFFAFLLVEGIFLVMKQTVMLTSLPRHDFM